MPSSGILLQRHINKNKILFKDAELVSPAQNQKLCFRLTNSISIDFLVQSPWEILHLLTRDGPVSCPCAPVAFPLSHVSDLKW